jgi:uncharacterized membrane protein YhaH (DUF805 family)
MFNKPLSFTGRIGRLEYLISFIIFWSIAIGLTIIANEENSNILSFVKLIVSYFFIAQGAKRCHDLGRSGWFQLIPFYFIWMLIAKGLESDIHEVTEVSQENAFETSNEKGFIASQLIEKYKSNSHE